MANSVDRLFMIGVLAIMAFFAVSAIIASRYGKNHRVEENSTSENEE